jgi:hypothetical protein
MQETELLDIDIQLYEEPDKKEDPPEEIKHTPTAKKRGGKRHCTEGIHSRCIKRVERTETRRAWSESKLLDILDHDFEPGHSYHCISGGDIDSLSYLKAVIRRQNLNYVLFSTWCLADDDILQFREWFEQGRIKHLDCYVGEIFPGSYRHEYAYLKEMLHHYDPAGRVCVFKNHSKIYAGTGDKFGFAIESSANINTNPRTENTTINIGTDIYRFYKDFFDGIKSFNNDYPDWLPREE